MTPTSWSRTSRPRVMDHFGLDWETVHALNPAPLHGANASVGTRRPVEAIVWASRPTSSRPVGSHGLPATPICRSSCAVSAIQWAACTRWSPSWPHSSTVRRPGRASSSRCALTEPALNLAAEQIIEWSAYGELLTRNGNRGPAAAPQGLLSLRWHTRPRVPSWDAASPGWPSRSRPTHSGKDSGAPLGDPDWAAAPAFETAEGRRSGHDAIDQQLGEWAAKQDAEQASEALLSHGVPAAPLVNAHFLMPNPQLEHRGFYFTREHPFTGSTRYPGFPARFRALTKSGAGRPAPTLGQHNEEILGGELGKSEAELDRLREAKVIGTRPAWEMG